MIPGALRTSLVAIRQCLIRQRFLLIHNCIHIHIHIQPPLPCRLVSRQACHPSLPPRLLVNPSFTMKATMQQSTIQINSPVSMHLHLTLRRSGQPSLLQTLLPRLGGVLGWVPRASAMPTYQSKCQAKRKKKRLFILQSCPHRLVCVMLGGEVMRKLSLNDL